MFSLFPNLSTEIFFNFINLLRETAFDFIDFLYYFSAFISLVSTLIFITSLLLLPLGLADSFPNFLQWMLRSDVSSKCSSTFPASQKYRILKVNAEKALGDQPARPINS